MVSLAQAANVYFNYENKSDYCYNISDTSGTGTLQAQAWDVLVCNQIPMIDSNGEPNTSVFVINDPDDFEKKKEAYTKNCQDKYGLTPDFDYATTTFGGAFNYSMEYQQYSKIIFSNGVLDPWTAGGVTKYTGLDIPTFMIKGGAHHLDMRLPSEDDPNSVSWVREQEMELIRMWIKEYQEGWV